MNGSADTAWNADLALSVLCAERVIAPFIAAEVRKNSRLHSMDDIFAALERHRICLSSKKKIDLGNIYDIISRENIAPSGYRVVKAYTPSKIRRMIGKWYPPAAGQMKIGEVLQDICTRIAAAAEGEWYYYTGKRADELSPGRFAYKLKISGDAVIFFDLNRGISYHVLT